MLSKSSLSEKNSIYCVSTAMFIIYIRALLMIDYKELLQRSSAFLNSAINYKIVYYPYRSCRRMTVANGTVGHQCANPEATVSVTNLAG
jgi:hypothetical protein